MAKRAVVTGGAGFIGSHLVDRLLDDGHEVVIIDNLSNGNLDNLARHKENERFEFRNLDVSDYSRTGELEEAFRDANWVLHLAALADIVPSINDPLKYYQSNVDGTINVLEAARKNDVERFLYTASSSCYGIPDDYPTPEKATVRPQYPYALTKYLGECLALHWEQVYHLPVVSLRLFNVYGPRARTSGTYGAVFGVFLAQKLHGQPFTVVGDGSQTRDFTYVSDIIDGFIKAAESDVSGEIMNLGSGNTYSVNRLTELMDGEVVHIPKRPGEPDCTFADITKARKLIGYEPKVPFEEGVKIMLDNIDYWKTAPLWTPDNIENATKDWFKYLAKDNK